MREDCLFKAMLDGRRDPAKDTLVCYSGILTLLSSEVEMRCREGDLAVLLHSLWGNTGRFVHVLEFLGKKRANNVSVYEDCWAISFSGETHDPVTGVRWGAPDIYLLPIRPGDLEETELRAKDLEFVHD